MGERVWVGRAMEHASNQRPFRNDVAERDPDRLLEIQRCVERGERLTPAELPTEVFGQPYAKEQDYRLPHLFYAYGYWVVSRAAGRGANVVPAEGLEQTNALSAGLKPGYGGVGWSVTIPDLRARRPPG